MNILVTGGNGLVGKNIEEYVMNLKDNTNKWKFLKSSEVDLTNYEHVFNFFTEFKPTHVINLAAYVGGLYKNMREPVEFFNNNILININVIRCCYEFNVKKLVSVMSTCIFPDKIEYPITEDKLHNGPPHPSNECYSYAKRMIDVLTRSYNKQYETKFVTVIPGNIYGPYDNFNLEDGHVIPALINKCYIAKEQEKDFVVFGTGNPLRQFTYASDIALLLVKVLFEYEDYEKPIIISTSEEISIKQVVSYIAETMNFKGNVIFDDTKNDGQYKKTISNDKLLKFYPECKFIDTKYGIEKSVLWFIENYKIARK